MGPGDLTDAEWERLRPFLPVSNGRRGRWRDHQQVIDGILHRVRTGVQWRDLPERFGLWKTVYERHRLLSAAGAWERLLQQVQAAADEAGEVDWDVSVDSTIVRAHQHAAGARTAPSPAPASKVVLTPGQRADCTQFKPVLEKIRVPRVGPGRPRKKPDSLAADRAYSNRPCREYLRRRGIRHSIQRRPKARPPAYAKAHGADGHPASTKTATRNATPLSGPSTGTNSPARSPPPATTSAATSTSAPPQRQPWSSGSGHDRPDTS
ncbi:hypothetical protein SUDANB2_07168 [Streptomyces sp. enrichment culture]